MDLETLAYKLKYELPALLTKVVNDGLIDVGNVIVKVAKSSHRFTNRTGRLESSIKSRASGKGVEAYLDTGVAKYASYVHEGTKYLEPDPFLDAALSSSAIDKAVDVAVGRAITIALERL